MPGAALAPSGLSPQSNHHDVEHPIGEDRRAGVAIRQDRLERSGGVLVSAGAGLEGDCHGATVSCRGCGAVVGERDLAPSVGRAVIGSTERTAGRRDGEGERATAADNGYAVARRAGYADGLSEARVLGDTVGAPVQLIDEPTGGTRAPAGAASCDRACGSADTTGSRRSARGTADAGER